MHPHLCYTSLFTWATPKPCAFKTKVCLTWGSARAYFGWWCSARQGGLSTSEWVSLVGSFRWYIPVSFDMRHGSEGDMHVEYVCAPWNRSLNRHLFTCLCYKYLSMCMCFCWHVAWLGGWCARRAGLSASKWFTCICFFHADRSFPEVFFLIYRSLSTWSMVQRVMCTSSRCVYTRVRTHAHTHTYSHIVKQPLAATQFLTQAHTYTPSLAHTHTYKQTHTHTHTKHTHTLHS